ncbi:DUF2470 domain-containing protein [Microbacterium sp. cx-59]|uniref:DUF2470 domain-containing protein n=1 Tax=Microbacterium sp. cx-59 TaxID=2891207 RepID=UPI001E59D7FF|nr:DUF2470 domain-containing protein [Microbacterium sp. cx-59]MCC4909480.1 DUF2470 domain-containing protein [Microbacterium sp. cx-59]
MPHAFDDQTVTAVLGHMNSDHTDDNILIARAFGDSPAPESARMTGFDGDGGDWVVTTAGGETAELRVPWPGGPITARPEVRREVVALYDEACRRLGITPRPH